MDVEGNNMQDETDEPQPSTSKAGASSPVYVPDDEESDEDGPDDFGEISSEEVCTKKHF